MRWKNLATAVALAVGALVLGAVFGRPGSGQAAGTSTAPGNTSTPTISGTPQENETLTASDGTWSGSPTSYTYAWSRCDANGDSCAAISGATAKTYTATSDDIGHTLRVTVTATNADGSTSATSAPTAVVSSAAAPKSTALPAITGTAQVGSTLTAGKGTWSGTVTGYTYAWKRCDSQGNSCSTIDGATSATYKLTQADAGTTIRTAVTATNSAGSTTATSAQTAMVPTPVTTGCPSGTGAIPIADVAQPARLAIDQQSITPARLTRSTHTIQLHFRVTACNRPVQGASVFAASIPYNQFEGTSGTTSSNGTVTLTERREAGFPADRHQELLAVLVRASKPGQPILGGISTRRTVSFPVTR
ncbi:MAG TPA: hypothetical protein VLW49_04800 [Gaiellaceae bacterium]|nr:hypothetical protein [Gaiellaceae bacterium]